jgi:hypothetical protein
MKITTKTGFQCDVNEKILNDYRFVKAIAKTKSKDPLISASALFDLVDLLIGDDTELITHCTEDGIAKTERASEEITDIIEQIGKDSKIKK